MKLEEVSIKGYRSIFGGGDAYWEPLVLRLGEGMNAIVGPNNAGKSNILRAIALALDPEASYDRSRDMVAGWTQSKPTVTLTFRIPKQGATSSERTLLRYVGEYEKMVNPNLTRTWASQGIVKLRVTIEGADDSAGTRREAFVVSGVGARSLPYDDPLAVKAVKKFHQCFHFVMISSGQSLESLMEGRFRDSLRAVLKEDLTAQYDAAVASRHKYLEDLQGGLLEPMRARIHSEVTELFPEVNDVALIPNVAELDDTLGGMRVKVADRAHTDLAEKGTGVRGGLIIAMLRHFAEVGKRSMLFAVEEPESFLHPAAQEALRDDLVALANRPDVSLLVTTHSPYIPSRLPEAKVFGISKGPRGNTKLDSEAAGSSPQAGVLGGLFREQLVADWLDKLAHIDAEAGAFIIVEGSTDEDFAKLALERAGRPDLLDGLCFVQAGLGQISPTAGGASLAVMQALVMRSMTDRPVVVLLDADGEGVGARDMLKKIGGKTGEWKVGKSLFSYGQLFKDAQFPYEAEDLWPDHLYESFLSTRDENTYLKGKVKRPNPEGGWHFDLDAKVKGELIPHLDAEATADDCSQWVALFELIRKGCGLPLPVGQAEDVASSPG